MFPRKKLEATSCFCCLFKGTPFSQIKINNFEVHQRLPKWFCKPLFRHDSVSPVSVNVKNNFWVFRRKISWLQECAVCGYPHFRLWNCTSLTIKAAGSGWASLSFNILKNSLLGCFVMIFSSIAKYSWQRQQKCYPYPLNREFRRKAHKWYKYETETKHHKFLCPNRAKLIW